MEDRRPQVEEIYRSPRKKACLEQALVLEAAGIKHEIRTESGEYSLLVANADAERARAEIDAYQRENRARPTRVAMFRHHAGAWIGVYAYVSVLLLAAILRDRHVFGFDWFVAGRTNAELIRQGQWWRTVTALSLHADMPHLVGNVVVGGLFGLFTAQLLGSGLAWLSILCAGAAGNAINAWIRPPQHTSVGASTAIFAALGILAAYVWMRRSHLRTTRLAYWGPLVGGVVLLGYFGTGGARTDVVAHAAGFSSGLLLGALYGKLGDRLLFTTAAQFLLGAATLAVLISAWTLALLTNAT